MLPAHHAISMLSQLIIATMMVMMTVGIHATGLSWLNRMLRVEAQEEALHHVPAFSIRTLAFTVALVLALFALHGIEIWLYALLYFWVDSVKDLETAIYFSSITYGAVGYDDSEMSRDWRLVSAIEGINGVILIGWSTAFFVTVVAKLGRR